ncbi:MAG: right-handed parallel beta-helix repeat-containing protein, partial [Thermoplasmata archaeon]
MSSRNLLCFLVVFILIYLQHSAFNCETPKECIFQNLHEPIFIRGNENFTLENGVSGGSGTPESPYIIENLEIDCKGNFYGIMVLSTNAHFVIRNVTIYNFSDNAPAPWWYLAAGIIFGCVDNARIENCKIGNASSNRSFGICLDIDYSLCDGKSCVPQKKHYYNNNIVIKNNLFLNLSIGIDAFGDNIEIFSNTLLDCWYLRVIGSDNVSIRGNLLLSNKTGSGIGLHDCRYCTVEDNRMLSKYGGGISLWGGLSSCTTHTITNNTINGKEIIYIKNETNFVLHNNDSGEIIIANCSNFTIEHIRDPLAPIYIRYASNGIIRESIIRRVYVDCATNISIFNNSIIGDFVGTGLTRCKIENNIFPKHVKQFFPPGYHLWHRISFTNPNNCSFTRNTILHEEVPTDNGVSVNGGVNFTIEENIISACNYGLSLTDSQNNKIVRNTVLNCSNGMSVSYFGGNLFEENIIANCTMWGINNSIRWLNGRNTFIHNMFIDNGMLGHSQVLDNGVSTCTNDYNYNYWNDWTTPDKDNDGIVDIPYPIEGEADLEDRYPLAHPPHIIIIHEPLDSISFREKNKILLRVIAADQKIANVSILYRYTYENTYRVANCTLENGTAFDGMYSYALSIPSPIGPCKFEYLIRATDESGDTQETRPFFVFILSASPTQPQSVICEKYFNQIHIKWNPPSWDGCSPILSYHIYRGLSPGTEKLYATVNAS